TGKTVLVQGGAGAVGNYAIQLAKWGGAAKVLTTVSSPAKAELAAKAGADAIIDYRKEDVAARVMAKTDGGGVDHIVEVAFGKNMPVTLAVLRPFGIIAAYASDAEHEPKLPYYQLMARNAVIRLVYLYEVPADYEARMARDIAAWLVAGKAYHATAKVFPLDQVAAAQVFLESGAASGNVMIEVAGG
ncbi:MAG: zinc-binding dehydrogenase, partial [Alphaproteobacteria bacterium]|nr:zinc-binding dehydrogenase [Alphaproteobacteria bacterium]